MNGRRKWLIPVVLTVSLLANLGLAGFIAGTMLRKPAEPPRTERVWQGERPERPVRLSDEDRAAIRQLVRAAYAAAEAEIEARLSAQARLREALRAEPYVPEEAAAAAADVRAAESVLRERLSAEILPALESLNADQRSALARVLAAGGERRGRDRRSRQDAEAQPPR